MPKFSKLSFIIASMLLGSTANSSDLLSLYEVALQKDPTLSAARNTREADATLYPQALGAMLPQLSTTANQTAGNTSTLFTDHSISKTHSVSLDLEQSLFDLTDWYDLQQAGRLVSAADANLIAAKQDLMLRLTEAYFEVLKANDTLHFKKAQKAALAKELEQVQQRLNVGMVAITDVNETQARYDNAVSEVIQAANVLEDQREILAQITGYTSIKLNKLAVDIPLQLPTPNKAQAWLDTAASHNPTLLSAQFAVDAANSGYKSKQAEHLPKVAFTASRQRSRQGRLGNPEANGVIPNNSAQYGWTGTVSVSLDLFSGGVTRAQANSAYYNYQLALDSLELTKRATRVATSSAYRGVVTAISQVKALKQAVLSARTALKASRAAYEVGTRTSVDVLNSISELYKNEQLYTEARHALIVTQLKLKQAAGVLTRKDLEGVNALLVAEKK